MIRAASAGVALLLAALLATCGQRARAELSERMLGVGTPLEQLAGRPGAESMLEFNAARLHVSTVTLQADLATVLDRFDVLCDTSAPLLASELRDIHAEVHGRSSGISLHQNLGDAAVAVCLTQPTDAGLSELAQRAAAYARTGDLSVFGQVRYLQLRRTASGASHVVLAYSTGPLRLRDMFPERGDAAGSDLRQLPRPRASRRLLSAHRSDGESGMVAYAVQGAPGVALQRYVAELRAQGFRELRLTDGYGTERAFTSVVRGTAQLVVHSMKLDGETVVAAVTMDTNSQMEKSHVDE